MKPKILIINPNSDVEMTKAIQKTAENFAQDEHEVVCMSTPGAPSFIETYEDQSQAAPGMIKRVKENQDTFDAFIIACHCDPNLDVLKEITKKPVVGIGEASMKMASMLGHCFSVIQTTEFSIPIKQELVRKYHLQDNLASIRAAIAPGQESSDDEKYLKAAQAAIEEDGAEVIVLGCAGLTGLDKRLEKKLAAPVLDGIVCGLIVAAGLVKYGISTSKIRRYNPE
jgi:allantoin racemase